MRIEIVTTEEIIYSGTEDAVVVPGVEGQLGILPRHAPLITAITSGEVVVRDKDETITVSLSGGFIEVFEDVITILADSSTGVVT